MSVVCLIPARGGSQRIPDKNIRPFFGKPIISYSIENAWESRLFDDVVVSTDSNKIAEVAKEYGASVFRRSREMSDNNVGTQEVAEDFLHFANPNIDVLCVLYATAPLLSIEDLTLAHEMVVNCNRDYSFAVGLRPALHDAGQFYFGWADNFITTETFGVLPLIGTNTAMIPIADNRDCDINVEADWELAEEMFKQLRSRNE